jgi:hypothetical protein
MMGSVPEGYPPPLHAPTPTNSNPELAMLEDMLAPSAHAPLALSSTPSNISLRFPHDRSLPQGFSLSRDHGHSATMPTASSSQVDTPSNLFNATPLQAPADFSPTKVTGAKAPSPAPMVDNKGKKPKQPTATKSAGGTRISGRNKPQHCYAEKDEFADDEV